MNCPYGMDFSTLQCTRPRAFCVHGSVALDFPVALGDVSATSEDVWRSGTEGREVNHEEESAATICGAWLVLFPFDVDGIDFTD